MTDPEEPLAAESATRYVRSSEVVWRVGPDRVVLRRIGAPPETAGIDLIGDVAYVWIALDTPATHAELVARLDEADIVVVDLAADLAHLDEHALITTTTSGTDRPARPTGHAARSV